MGDRLADEFTVSGDSEWTYVSDSTGRIIARCEDTEDAQRIAVALNPPDENYYPLGKLDPDDPLDQAFVNAFNKGASRTTHSSVKGVQD